MLKSPQWSTTSDLSPGSKRFVSVLLISPQSLNWNLIFSSLWLIYVLILWFLRSWSFDSKFMAFSSYNSRANEIHWRWCEIFPSYLCDVKVQNVFVCLYFLLIKPITLSFTLIGTCRNQNGDLWTTQLMSALHHQPFVPSCASKVSISKKYIADNSHWSKITMRIPLKKLKPSIFLPLPCR